MCFVLNDYFVVVWVVDNFFVVYSLEMEVVWFFEYGLFGGVELFEYLVFVVVGVCVVYLVLVLSYFWICWYFGCFDLIYLLVNLFELVIGVRVYIGEFVVVEVWCVVWIYSGCNVDFFFCLWWWWGGMGCLD